MVPRPGLAIKRAERALIVAKSSALAPFGLTATEYTNLRILLDNPGTSAAEVARERRVTRQATSLIFASLDKRGLIERRPHPNHRALVEVRLSAAGRVLVEEADRAVLEVEARFVAGLSDRDIDLLQGVLQPCTDNLPPRPTSVRNDRVRSEISSIAPSIASAESLSQR